MTLVLDAEGISALAVRPAPLIELRSRSPCPAQVTLISAELRRSEINYCMTSLKVR